MNDVYVVTACLYFYAWMGIGIGMCVTACAYVYSEGLRDVMKKTYPKSGGFVISVILIGIFLVVTIAWPAAISGFLLKLSRLSYRAIMR